MTLRRTRLQRGLSMIEVLAAMAIFSAGASVLFSWIGQASDRLSRLGSEQQTLFAQLAALEYAKTINPMLQPSGTVGLADRVNLSWTSQAVGAIESARGQPSLYEVGLYRVELKSSRTGVPDSTQSVYLSGWRQVREAPRGGPFGPAPG